MITNYSDVKDQAQFYDVTLEGLKHQPSGAKKLTVINNLEFWVMNNAVQTINDMTLVINFQVGIKDLGKKTFTHALSNSHLNDSTKLISTISLVEYHKNQMLEKGDITFSCQQSALE